MWCPNNGLGVIIISLMYLEAGIAILGGIYLVFPIYIGKIGHILLELLIERIAINEDEDDDEEDIREKVKCLRKNYLW